MEHANVALFYAAATVPIFILLPAGAFYYDLPLIEPAGWLLRTSFAFGIADIATATGFVAWSALQSGGVAGVILMVATAAFTFAFSLLTWALMSFLLMERGIWGIYKENSEGGRQ